MSKPPRRHVLRWMVASPVGLALGCGGPEGADGGAADDGGRRDGGASDAGSGDAAIADGGSVDGGPPIDGGELCEPTDPDALGPFYEPGAPTRMRIADPAEPGDRLDMSGALVSAADCRTPLVGYTIDLWQADALGVYHDAMGGYRLRGVVASGPDGAFSFETIKPGNYDTATGRRPSHLHVRVWTPGGDERLTTQIYFAGDPFLGAADGCQPPTCDSSDPARIVSLRPATVGGVDGFAGSFVLVVPT